MTDLKVPKLNNNDSHYLLVEWLVPDGTRVRPGDVVATIETSKALEDLEADAEGTLRHLLAAGAECAPGQALARLEGAHQPDREPAAAPADTPVAREPEPLGAEVVITAPARVRLAELGIDPARLGRLGLRVVRREDVDRLAELERQDAAAAGAPEQSTTDEAPEQRALSRNQQAVAAIVTRSHAAVPPSYLAVRVQVAEALRLTTRLSAEQRRFAGLAELLIAAVARRHADFPLCFAASDDAGTAAAVPPRPHVGVTVDLGTGLYVPVVHDAATRSVAEIAGLLEGYRDNARRGRFREAELTGANIMVALHSDEDVLFGVPIVFPGHACALSLSATRQEARPGPDGQVVFEPVVTLGVAHDHRLVNGQDATKFLRAVKAALENPESLLTPR